MEIEVNPLAEVIDINKDYREAISDRFTVADNGDLTIHVHPGYDYEITHDRLSERDWLSHIKSKSWPAFDFGDFVVAYFHACTKAGLRTVTVDLARFTNEYYK